MPQTCLGLGGRWLGECDRFAGAMLELRLGKGLGYQGMYYMVKDLAASAGLENIHSHRGRHTFARWLIKDEMDAYFEM